MQQGGTVLASLCGGYPPAQVVSQELHPVADAQHRQLALQHVSGQLGGIRFVHTAWPAAEDKTARVDGQHLFCRGIVAKELAIDLGLAHAPGDELAVLRPKIEDGQRLAGWRRAITRLAARFVR